MPLYEVFIPNENNDGKGRKGQVRADSWTAALKTGLKKVGGSEVDTRSLMCDIKPDGRMDVTDPKSGRVFVIRDLDASKDAPEIIEVQGRGKLMRVRLRKSSVSFSVRPVKCTTIRPSKKHRALFLDWLKRRFQVSRAQSSSQISVMMTFSLLRQLVQRPVRL